MDDGFDMKDDGGRPAGKQRRGGPSLVERAAQKLTREPAAGTSPRRSAPQPADPVPQPPPEPLADFDLPPAAAAPVREATRETASAPAQPAFEEGLVEQALQAPAGADAVAAPAAAAKPSAPAAAGSGRAGGSRTVQIDLGALAARNIVTPLTKRNRTIEEFRLIKRMVLSRRWDESDAPGNAIVVTSALPSEGKTTTAINLAMSIAAEEDLRVVLVDADFVKPDALRQLGVSASKGLIDVLHNPKMDISDVILRTNVEKLSLIPSGQLHDRCTELLASARMDEVITELAHRYEDRILIFDSPPILATTESVTLASHMGQIVFVVQAGRTKRETVASALELIGDRANLGMVLNRTTSSFGRAEFGAYYGSYYYGYGHDRDRDAARS